MSVSQDITESPYYPFTPIGNYDDMKVVLAFQSETSLVVLFMIPFFFSIFYQMTFVIFAEL